MRASAQRSFLIGLGTVEASRAWRPSVLSFARLAGVVRQSMTVSAADADRLYVVDMMPLAYRCLASAEQHTRAALQLHTLQPATQQSHVAVQQCLKGLVALIQRQHAGPTHMAIAVDVPGALSFRHKMWPRYKANRHELQLSSHQEIARILCLVDAMDIPILLVPGVEADDVCATLASRALRVGFSVTVVSPNKAFYQLLQPNLSILKYAESAAATYTHEDFAQEFEVPANLWCDVKALTGSASGNIPGVKGVGEQTALQLVKELGTVEDILQGLNEASVQQDHLKLRKGQLETLCSHEGDVAARLSKELATLVTNLKAPPLRQSWELFRLKVPAKDGKSAIELAQSMKLPRIAAQLRLLYDNQGKTPSDTC